MSLVTIHIQDHQRNQPGAGFRADWNLVRVASLTYATTEDGEAAADEAFHITNAPGELLTDLQKIMLGKYHGPSLSVGDMVTVVPMTGGPAVQFLCASCGWESRVFTPTAEPALS